jgi:hypothetical protein
MTDEDIIWHQPIGLLESLLSSQAINHLLASPQSYDLRAHTNDNTSARDGVRVRFPSSALSETLFRIRFGALECPEYP